MPPRPRANAATPAAAGVLALLPAAMLVWFALDNVVTASGWTSLVLQNVVGGVIAAGLLSVAVAFTFARWIVGAWTLCGLCVFYVVAIFVTPLLRGTAFGAQLKWVFGFDQGDGAATGLAVIFAVLMAITATIAGSLRSRDRPPPRHPVRTPCSAGQARDLR